MTQENFSQNNKRRIIPLTQWNQYHPWPNNSGLRHLVFNADTNGFNKVIRRAGRRVLIDEPAFFEWLDTQSEGSKHND
jgi:hypothetical protein